MTRTGREPAPLAERFWSHVQKTDGCWLWIGTKTHGYGTMMVSVMATDGRPAWRGERAPRISFELAYGPIPPGQHVLHQCDTPACVRPDHLRLGTARDNALDKEARGRGGHRPLKLTEATVVAIRSEYAKGIRSQSAIAKSHMLSHETIRAILYGQMWKRAGGPISVPPIRAETLWTRKLAPEQVHSIIMRYRAGETSMQLAGEYGVSHTAIWAILTGRSWKHIWTRLGLVPGPLRSDRPPRTGQPRRRLMFTADHVELARTARGEGKTLRLIAKELDCSHTTVRRLLQ